VKVASQRLDVLEIVGDGSSDWLDWQWCRHFTDRRLIGEFDRDRFCRSRRHSSGAQFDRRFRLAFQIKPYETDAFCQT